MCTMLCSIRVASLTMPYYDVVIELDWVVSQTMERKRREMEEVDREYAERLQKAKQKEELLRKAARARVHKRQVRTILLHICSLANICSRKHLMNHKMTT